MSAGDFALLCDDLPAHEPGRNSQKPSLQTRDKPFECPTCRRRFVWICHLRNHERVHKANRIHESGKGFSRSRRKTKKSRRRRKYTVRLVFPHGDIAGSRSLVESVHEISFKSSQNEENQHMCSHCGRFFANDWSVKRHEDNRECWFYKEKPYLCSKCGVFFAIYGRKAPEDSTCARGKPHSDAILDQQWQDGSQSVGSCLRRRSEISSNSRVELLNS